jgi:hypothetical protein
MAGPFLTRDAEVAVQLEAAFGTSPGALAGTDFFKSRTRYAFRRIKARRDRDGDGDRGQASVITTQGGREKSSWSVEGDIVPASIAGTPTAPDMDAFFEAHMGTKVTTTAHTTTGAGTTGTSLVLTAGGGAASGIPVGGGILIAIDVDAANGVEVRFVVSRTTDTVVMDRALSANPIAGRAVYVPGATYKLSASTLKSLHLWSFLDGDNFRHKVPGAVPRMMQLGCDFTPEVPVGTCQFSGEGMPIETHATARPTPVTAGLPLVPTISRVWFGTAKHCITKVDLQSDNGIELRENQSCTLFPSGVKRTGNNGRYNITQAISVLLETGTVEGYYDAADDLTAYDVIVQLGVAPGSIVAWRTPKFVPDTEIGEQDGEMTLDVSGRVYGVTGDDGLYLSFI